MSASHHIFTTKRPVCKISGSSTEGYKPYDCREDGKCGIKKIRKDYTLSSGTKAMKDHFSMVPSPSSEVFSISAATPALYPSINRSVLVGLSLKKKKDNCP
jgi:hypothetical protein